MQTPVRACNYGENFASNMLRSLSAAYPHDADSVTETILVTPIRLLVVETQLPI